MGGPTLEFHPDADAEAESAVDWYVERSIAAAEGFLDELERAMEQIRDAPDRWASYLHGTRRYLIQLRRIGPPSNGLLRSCRADSRHAHSDHRLPGPSDDRAQT